MFKKNIAVLQTRPLSGKDGKKLRKDLERLYPSLSDEDHKRLFANKTDVNLLRLSNKAQVYACIGGNPLFFDPTGREDVLIPTVYALWLCPKLLNTLYTHSEVSPKVLGGADLFLQGLIVPDQGLGSFASGDLMLASIPQNQFPFAIGVMEASSADTKKNGLKGKGLKLLHHYPDMLWALGDKSVPDPSFTPTRVFPQTSSDHSVQQDSASESAAQTETEAPTAEVNGMHLADNKVSPDAATPPHSSPSPASREPDDGASESAAPDNMDSIVEGLLIAGLHSLDDDDLPMQTNEFYSKAVLGCKPAGLAVDIKKSTYKNLAKLLKAFEKKGLFGTKQVHKQDSLVSINRQHDLYTTPLSSWLPTNQSGSASDRQSKDVSSSGNGSAAAPQGQVTVSYWYRVPSTLRPLLGSSAAPKDELYSEEQIRAVLDDYAAANSLQIDSSSVKLDKVMVSNLFNKKEPQMEGDACPLEEVVKRLLGKLQLFHKITRVTEQGPVEVVKKGSIRNIQLTMEDRQGGRKHVTRVIHVESFGFDADELAGILQRKFQTSSSVTKLPGKSETGKEIALQGPLLHEIPKFLTATYGLSSSFMDVKAKGK